MCLVTEDNYMWFKSPERQRGMIMINAGGVNGITFEV